MSGALFKKGLNGNVLKIIALVAMTFDHVGKVFFPETYLFNIIGRIAYPIFAFMIAEGCYYTRHKARYFSLVFGVGVLCFLGVLLAFGQVYLNILITFSFSIAIIFSLNYAIKNKKFYLFILPALIIFSSALISYCFIDVLDYGFFGVLIPVAIYFCKDFRLKLVALAWGLLLLGLTYGDVQWYAFLSLLFIMFYDGTRGKLNLKYLFYVYYPLHFVAIYGVNYLI